MGEFLQQQENLETLVLYLEGWDFRQHLRPAFLFVPEIWHKAFDTIFHRNYQHLFQFSLSE